MNVTIHETINETEWEKVRKLMQQWDLWGLVALLSPLAAFALMALKIPR